MDTTDIPPITGLDPLSTHLDDLALDPSLPLNPKLFDDVELQLTETNTPPLIPRFLPRLTSLLQTYNVHDPTIIASLTTKLLRPLSFTQILGPLAPEASLIQALESPLPAANLLAMTVLHKAAAARSPTDVAILSTMPALVAAFIRRWLAAPQVELAPPARPRNGVYTAENDLVLRRVAGQGKMWRRVLGDKGVYGLLVDLCAGRHADTATDARQLSLAQGRVLRVLPRLAALDIRAVSKSEFQAAVGLTNGHQENGDGGANGHGPRSGEGLLQFAALHMVDKSDVLLHLSLVDFFEMFVGLARVTEYSAYKVETVRALLRAATAQDAVLKEALVTLPERTVEDEAEDLKRWLQEVMPGEEIRIAIR
ncbi:hypothetical protein B0T17DRAFT_535078 [Bombardia bombarda]|uniref:DNA mismatch repair protein HSM3 N-terminal domain-containing protein n=1 Tax=Bombardia bombarda TaxID=252184 RepID=A0AA40C2B7_9PEZI|nr:hypothetical protein B0T17DRAFT_535078 [Bombardia bombarda]